MTDYENNKKLLIDLLDSYRSAPPDTFTRAFLDHLIEASRRSAGKSEIEKQYHNLIILRYVVVPKPSMLKICKALHIGRLYNNYEAVTANAIDRLLVLSFGIGGINWLG